MGLYTMTLMQIYLYFTTHRGRNAASPKGFVVYLCGIETVQIVLAGGWIWVAQYWMEYRDILTIFIVRTSPLVNVEGALILQPRGVGKICHAMKRKGLRLQTLLPAVVIAITILELVSYIVILVHSLHGLGTSHVNWMVVALSKAGWAVNTAMSVAISGLFLQSYLNTTSDEEFVRPDKLAELAVDWVLNSGLATALVPVLLLISMMYKASDLEVLSATTFLLVPLHVHMFLAHLNSRAVEPAAKPPALSSEIEFAYRHQGDTTDTDTGVEHGTPFKDSLLEHASRATEGAGSGEIDPARRPRANYPALRACALVCSDWRSRSQFNLLRIVTFSRAAQADLLLQAIAFRPSFADCIYSIAIDDNPDGYIPFAHPLFRRLRGCRKLDLAGVDWTMYPPTTLDLVPRFANITDLSLSFDHLTYSAAFRVVWAIPSLQTLGITGVGKKPARRMVGELLGALARRRKPNAYVELKSLIINEVRGYVAVSTSSVSNAPRSPFSLSLTGSRHAEPSERRSLAFKCKYLEGRESQNQWGDSSTEASHNWIRFSFSFQKDRGQKGHGLGHTFTGLSSVLPHSGNVFRGRGLHLSLPFNSRYGASRTEFLNILHEVLLARAQPEMERESEGVRTALLLAIFWTPTACVRAACPREQNAIASFRHARVTPEKEVPACDVKTYGTKSSPPSDSPHRRLDLDMV
ncbi:hypothetical protein V8D89_004491 [Ganoderma adspersum]